MRGRNDLFTACKLKVIAAGPSEKEQRTPFAAANENELAFSAAKSTASERRRAILRRPTPNYIPSASISPQTREMKFLALEKGVECGGLTRLDSLLSGPTTQKYHLSK